jgi:hypothetical protein
VISGYLRRAHWAQDRGSGRPHLFIASTELAMRVNSPGESCCPVFCGPGHCCSTGETCMPDGCCPSGRQVCGGECCAQGASCCAGECCGPGDHCCGSACCPANVPCGPDGFCAGLANTPLLPHTVALPEARPAVFRITQAWFEPVVHQAPCAAAFLLMDNQIAKWGQEPMHVCTDSIDKHRRR